MCDGCVSREEFREVVDVVEQLQEEIEEKDEKIEDLEERVDDVEQQLEERATVRWDSADERDATIESTDGTVYPLGRAIKTKITERDLQEHVDEVLENYAPDVDAEEENEDLLPIQQLARLPEDVAETQLNNAAHKNTYRARNVWKDIGDYGAKTPKGLVLRSGEMRRVLSALEDDGTRIESKTVHRVMTRIEEYSAGVVEREKRDGEWLIVVPRDFQEQAREAATPPPDTAVRSD